MIHLSQKMLFSIILWTALAAGAAKAADQARLQAFLQVTGFDVALDSISLSASGAPQMLGMTETDFGSDWARVSEEVFDREKMHDMALEILGATLDDEDLQHAAEFYASPLGQRLVEVENASHMAPDDTAKQAEGEALVAADVAVGGQRVAVLKGLSKAVDSSGTAVRAVQEIQFRFLMAASQAGVIDYELDEGALRALLAEGENELRLSMQKAGLAGAAATYKDIPIEDLKAYLSALEHPRMARVYELMNAVQYEIMANRFEALAMRMADLHPGQEL